MILVFGSLNVDVLVPVPYLPGRGETVLGSDYRLAPGGKGANQALAARRAGSLVAMAGAVGSDPFADIALALLREAGVALDRVATVDRPTGCAAIMIDAAGENAIAVAPGANLAATAALVPDAALGSDTVVVLQQEVPDAENAALAARARQHGARIVLNLAPAGPAAPSWLGGVDLLIANRGEAASLGDVRVVAGGLRQALVVTNGAAGATAYLASGGDITVPALPVTAMDSTGAGDCFVGVLAAGLDQGLDLGTALYRASAAAALTCLAVGAQPAMPDRLAIEAAAARLRGPITAAGNRGIRRGRRDRSPA